MRGRLERRRWRPDPDLYAPARYRRPCDYEVFIPEPLAPPRIRPRVRSRQIASEIRSAVGIGVQIGGRGGQAKRILADESSLHGE
jgi:hypothetical protein